MYSTILMLHGTWRWVVLALGLAVVVLVVRGLARQRPWEPRMALVARLFGICVDVQVLIGAALYLTLSPLTTVAEVAAGSGEPGSDLGFINGYHVLIMLGAFVAVHAAAVLVRRARTDAAKHWRALMLYGLTLVIVVSGTPWWRPLLRL